MKKLLLAVALFSICSVVKAETMCTNWGSADLCVPVTTGIDAAFGYDFRSHRSQGLAETAFAYWHFSYDAAIAFKAGGITTENGKGAPFLGVDYELKEINNPIPGIASIHPGIYGGHDFHTNEWFYGIKASIPILK